MPRLESYLGDGPRKEDLEPYLGKRVRITMEFEGTFTRFYGNEIMLLDGCTRYLAKRHIAAIEELEG